MTTYYVRHDGTQTVKANALVGGAAALALSVAGFNAETFVAGDTIIFENSGTYTTPIVFAATGTALAPITIQGPAADERNHADVKVTGANGITVTGSHLRVRNFNLWGNSDKCIYIGNSSGVGGYTIKIYDCIAMENAGGDGFGTNSTANDASEVEWIRCEARAITGANNQGFTNHIDQKTIMTDCSTTSACETAMTMIGNYCEVNGGSFIATDVVFYASQGCQLVVNDATGLANTALARIFKVDLSGQIIFNDCTLSHLAPSVTNNSIVNDNVSVIINGGTFNYSATPTSGVEWATSGPNALLKFAKGVVINMIAMGARLARTNASGGNIIVQGAFINCADVGGSGTRVLFEIRNTSNGALSVFSGNVVIGPTPANFFVWRQPISGTSPIFVCHNAFMNITGSGSAVLSNQLATATAVWSVYNNIFYNCTDAISGTTSLTSDYNVCYGGTPVEADAHAQTFTPLFAGGTTFETIEDFYPLDTSPVIHAGAYVSPGITDFFGQGQEVIPTIGPVFTGLGRRRDRAA